VHQRQMTSSDVPDTTHKTWQLVAARRTVDGPASDRNAFRRPENPALTSNKDTVRVGRSRRQSHAETDTQMASPIRVRFIFYAEMDAKARNPGLRRPNGKNSPPGAQSQAQARHLSAMSNPAAGGAMSAKKMGLPP